MTLINEHKGTVKRIRKNKVTIELPRGGTFTAPTDRKFKVGEKVCFIMNPVLNKILEILPEKEADEIVQIGQDESTHGILMEDYEGMDLEDDDPGYSEEDELEHLANEEEADDPIDDQGQIPKIPFDFECGETGSEILEPGDYFADEDHMEKPGGFED